MKRLKVLFGTLLVAATVVGAFAFTSNDFHKAADIRCFSFDLPTADDVNVILPGSYSSGASSASCITPRLKYCMLCFDADTHGSYLSGSNLDFSGNSTLRSTVLEAYEDPSNQGVPVNGITFHYKP